MAVLRKILHIMTFGANGISGVIIFALMLLITADTLSLYLLSKPFGFTVVFAEASLIVIVLFSFAATEAKGGNVRLLVLYQLFSPKVKLVCDVIAYLAGLAIMSIITFQSWQYAIASWEMGEWAPGAVIFPLYPFKFAVPVGSGLLALQLIVKLIRRILVPKNNSIERAPEWKTG